MRRQLLGVRGFLLHLTHYDPVWCRKKAREKPFDLGLAMEIVDAMAEANMNLLIIDIADAVKYKCYPKLAKHYTQPMSTLKRLVRHAEKAGMEVVPKLNFSRSHFCQHNHWFGRMLWGFDTDIYFENAFRLIDELIDVTRPRRFFHIGMDEDHDRSYTQYVAAIQRLHDGLTTRGLRTIIWNDSSCLWEGSHIHIEKALLAETRIPKDIVHMLWDYQRVDPRILRRIRRRGFELWGAPGSNPDRVAAFRDALHRTSGTGAIITKWIPCRPGNRKTLLKTVHDCGRVLAASEGTIADSA